jgi:hypothetical protein
MTELGYVVLAKRPDRRGEGEFTYETAGGVWPTIEPVENHLAYCQMSAEADRTRYGDVEYVIGRISLAQAAG